MATIIKATDRNRGVHGVAFNFDDMTDRANAYLDEVRAKAAKILADATKQAERMRKQAETQGRQAAEATLEKRIHQQVESRLGEQLKTLTPALQETIEQLSQAKQTWMIHWEQSAVKTACAIAERLIRHELGLDPAITTGLIRESLELAAGSARLRIHLSERDHEALLPQVESLVSQLAPLAETHILPDSTITPGSCRVETEFGVIDQDWRTQLARIEEELT